MSVEERLQDVRDKIAKAAEEAGREPDSVSLVAVSKTFDAEHIRPTIQVGQRVFGENRVQESKEKWPALRAAHPGLPVYPAGQDGVRKLSAAWLIEQAGLKGYRDGDAGVHAKQALVLVNYGGATGAQLLALARRIQADIQARFGVSLEIEPNIL